MTAIKPYKPQALIKDAYVRKHLPVGVKYPSYQFLDSFPVLGAIDFWTRNHQLKKEFQVADSGVDIFKKATFYAAHTSVLVGSVVMAIQPVREQIFDLVEKFGNYFL